MLVRFLLPLRNSISGADGQSRQTGRPETGGRWPLTDGFLVQPGKGSQTENNLWSLIDFDRKMDWSYYGRVHVDRLKWPRSERSLALCNLCGCVYCKWNLIVPANIWAVFHRISKSTNIWAVSHMRSRSECKIWWVCTMNAEIAYFWLSIKGRWFWSSSRERLMTNKIYNETLSKIKTFFLAHPGSSL